MTLNNSMSITPITPTVPSGTWVRHGSFLSENSGPLRVRSQCNSTDAAYAAAKAYVRSFGEALHVELAPRNVHVTVLSPGLMDTGFLDTAGQASSASLRRMMTPVAKTAKVGVDALFKGRASVIAGAMNRLTAFSNRLTPRMLQARVAGRMMR